MHPKWMLLGEDLQRMRLMDCQCRWFGVEFGRLTARGREAAGVIAEVACEAPGAALQLVRSDEKEERSAFPPGGRRAECFASARRADESGLCRQYFGRPANCLGRSGCESCGLESDGEPERRGRRAEAEAFAWPARDARRTPRIACQGKARADADAD